MNGPGNDGVAPPGTGEPDPPSRFKLPPQRPGVTWDYELVDSAGLWPPQLGLDTCGECDMDEGRERA